MLNLFSQNPAEAGFRFHEAEILNWGTFDREIYRIAPGGETSLITGANGSGKTTFIDALLSLLVPEKRMRFYNQSSGAASRHDRTEESYVLGEYGQIENESGKVIERLRQRDQGFFSVLLANFFNQGLQQWVCLAQVRWFAGSDLRRVFVIARARLSIAEHLAPLDSDGQWKRRLKTSLGNEGQRGKTIQFMDQPGEYARELRKLLGMRSEKAQTLFSQTIGLKVLGNLNDFVRSHMLEESPAEAEFERLRDSYRQLLSAHTTLHKLRCQLELLNPIESHHGDWLTQQQTLSETQDLLEALPWFDADQRLGLLERDLLLAAEQHAEVRRQRSRLEQQRDQLQQDRAELEHSIRSDATGQQLKALSQRIRERERELERRHKALKTYNRLAKGQQRENPDTGEFQADREQRPALLLACRQALEAEKKALLDRQIARETHHRAYVERARELEDLKRRKNNISGDEARIRTQLLEHLGLSESELPFIGELLQIKASEWHWELGIEKVLRNFALHLLVPDSRYQAVNAWVNATDLRGRIRYYRLRERSLAPVPAFMPDMLPGKLEIHPQSPARDWLRQQLAERFNYLCSDDLELFQRADYALTSRGLIRNRDQHLKDDRRHTFDRGNYVLGWDNRDKIRFLEQELKQDQQSLAEHDKAIGKGEKSVEQLQAQIEALTRLQEDFPDFEPIDIEQVSFEIARLRQDLQALEQENQSIRILEARLRELEQTLRKLEAKRDSFVREEDRLQQGRERLDQSLQQVRAKLTQIPTERLPAIRAALTETFSLSPVDALKRLDQQTKDLDRQLQQRQNNLRQTLLRHEQQIERAMRAFKYPDPDFLASFSDWRNDTYAFGEDIGYVGDYLRYADRIRSQELVEQEARFQRYFNQSILERMTAFEQFLQRQLENIEDNLRALNRALRQISFRNAPRTYIQLKHDLLRKGRTADFREQLRRWKPVAADSDDPQVLEDSFLRIKALIEELEQRSDWRRDVTDVRNWMEFSAQEFYAEDEQLYRKYESTGKLSGGEKAQLTYTILGAAIAYQFNLSQEGTDTLSFRFICVDESFSNQDDEKAAYLMDLCRQLHLQLLVVTPNDKTHVVEPYISRIHLVLRRQHRNSVLIDMPIESFQQQRDQQVSA